MKILVVGDSYVTAAAFAEGLGRLEAEHQLDYLQLDEGRTLTPASASERRIREYAGTPDQLVERLDGHEALVVHGAPVTDAVLDASPALRLVCCARGGPVNVDLQAAAERAIPVTTTPGKNADAVVELTLAFLIMLARGLPRSQRFLLDGGRVGDSAFEGAQFFGRELAGRTLGLVGYGHVGSRVGRVAGALDMHVLAYDPLVDAARFGDGVRPADLDGVLDAAEFVSLHARATADNENLVDVGFLERMRPGAFLVNTARESLVDEAALLAALRSGRLAGAALDVVRPRPDGDRNPLLDEPSVVLTPHIGGATYETIARGVAMVADELERFAAGRTLLFAR